MSFYPHQFEAPVEYYDVGSSRYLYTVVWLPDAVAAQLPLTEFPRLRITGEANEVEFDAALMPVAGRHYLLFSRAMLRTMGAAVGDHVALAFRIADQEAVDIPAALAQALAEDEELSNLWDQQTAGKKRGLAYRVASAKSPATQARRIAEIFDIMTGRRDKYGKLIKD